MAGPSVLIVGGGCMGLASAWALARRGVAVTVLERHTHVHQYGSHSGHTRVIRQAYHEGSAYVSLIQRADRQWLGLQRRTATALLDRCGVLLFGPPDSADLRAAIETCRDCDLPHDCMSPRQIAERWPFVMPDDWLTCFDPSGGFLRVGPCLDALRDEAIQAGATVRYGTRVRALEHGATVAAVLDDGTTVSADRLVVAAGAWLPELVPSLLPGSITRTRRILAWTQPAPGHRAALATIPVWGVTLPSGFFYGFPYGDEGVQGLKVAVHTSEQPGLDTPVQPEAFDRRAHAADLDPLADILARHVPHGRGDWAATHACLYTHTPRWDFVVDRLPDDDRVVIAGAFSGHGFKFAPAIGEHVAELLLDHASPYPSFSIAGHQAYRAGPE